MLRIKTPTGRQICRLCVHTSSNEKLEWAIGLKKTKIKNEKNKICDGLFEFKRPLNQPAWDENQNDVPCHDSLDRHSH